MTIFYLLDDNTDPLDLIVINKKFRDRLKDNGIDGFEINRILQKRYGLKLDWPLSDTTAGKAARKQAKYARDWLNNICNYEIITDKEKISLKKIHDRLEKYMLPKGIKNNKGKLSVRVKTSKDKGQAKSFKQVDGMRIVELFNYISRFKNQKDTDTKIHLFIAELFKVTVNEDFTTNKIKKDYENNEKFFTHNKSS